MNFTPRPKPPQGPLSDRHVVVPVDEHSRIDIGEHVVAG
jgi:hypothetical protein